MVWGGQKMWRAGDEYSYFPEGIYIITAHGSHVGLGSSGFKQLRASCFPIEFSVGLVATFSFLVLSSFADSENATRVVPIQ